MLNVLYANIHPQRVTIGTSFTVIDIKIILSTYFESVQQENFTLPGDIFSYLGFTECPGFVMFDGLNHFRLLDGG